MKNIRSFISAILGGIAVSIGCTANLLLKDDSPLIAAFMFGIGFLAVVVFDLKLFTDKSGYLFTYGRLDKNIIKLIATMFGNIIGAFICGLAVSSRVYENAAIVTETKIAGSFVDLLVGSLICGMLIYIGVHGYRKAGGFTGCLLLFTATTMIMLCDFDYAIYNIFSISAYKNFSYIVEHSFDVVIFVLLSAVGNAFGAIIFATLCKIKDENDDESGHHHHHRRRKRHHSGKETTEVNKDTIEEAGF